MLFFTSFEKLFIVAGREEEVFDREEVLGRDATSVFPTESKAPAMDAEAVKAALGSNLRFVTESEVTHACGMARASSSWACPRLVFQVQWSSELTVLYSWRPSRQKEEHGWRMALSSPTSHWWRS